MFYVYLLFHFLFTAIDDVFVFFLIFFFKQKTAYEMRMSDWSSDVCSSDLDRRARPAVGARRTLGNLVVRARWLEQYRRAARRDDHAGNLIGLCEGCRIARRRQARRPRDSRRRSDAGHQQYRENPPRDAARTPL